MVRHKRWIARIYWAFDERIFKQNSSQHTSGWCDSDQAGVTVHFDGRSERFDHVIFACHSDQALKMLRDASSAEYAVLSKLEYQANDVVLHTDESLLPERQAAWASWNYRLSGADGEENAAPTLTYNMNILQHIDSPQTFVSL